MEIEKPVCWLDILKSKEKEKIDKEKRNTGEENDQ